MPLWIWIESKAKSIADTLLACRVAAALTIALLAPLSIVLVVSDASTVSTLTLLATVFCGLTLGIVIFMHGIRPIIKTIGAMNSGNPITWNDTVLAGITLFQTIYFVFLGYVHLAGAFVPYFYEINTSSDPDSASWLGIHMILQFVFLTSLTYYWAGMNRMTHVIKSLEESYRNREQGTIGELVATLPLTNRKFDSVLRLSTIVFLLLIQTKLNPSLFSSIDSSKLSTAKVVEQYAATATTIAAAGYWFIFLSMSLLLWDLFIWWNANKRGLHVPTPWQLHGVALFVSVAHYAFWRFGEAWVSSVPLCAHLAIAFVVLFLSWWQLIFIAFAPHMSTLKVKKNGGGVT